MLKLITCALALVAGAAVADGVPLITAAPALKAGDLSRQLGATKQADFVKLHPITLSKGSFGANVLTVVVDGKTYSFAGSMMAPLPAPKSGPKPTAFRAWSGKEPGGGTLVLTAHADGSVIASMFLPPNRRFVSATPAGGSAVLVETDANVFTPLILAPSGPAPLGAPK